MTNTLLEDMLLSKQASKQASKRLYGLDLFRVMAAFWVYAFHTGHINLDWGWLNAFVQMGACYMTGFFMLSGYLLYYVHGEQDLLPLGSLKKFYRKRIACIMPIYWVVALIFVVFMSKETWQQNLVLFPIEFLGLQSIFPQTFAISHNGGTWFISCIMVAYLFYPFIAAVVRQFSAKSTVSMYCLLAAVLLFSPVVVWMFKLPWIYDNPLFRLMEFTQGVLLAHFYHVYLARHGNWLNILQRWSFFAGAFVLMVVAISLAVHWHIAVGNYMLYSWIVLPLFSLQILSLTGLSAGWLRSRLFQYCSAISYAFFLAQYFCWQTTPLICEWLGIEANIIAIGVSFGLCVVIAALLYELVQKPAKRLILQQSS